MRSRMVLVACVLVLGLVGCGDDDGSSPSAGSGGDSGSAGTGGSSGTGGTSGTGGSGGTGGTSGSAGDDAGLDDAGSLDADTLDANTLDANTLDDASADSAAADAGNDSGPTCTPSGDDSTCDGNNDDCDSYVDEACARELVAWTLDGTLNSDANVPSSRNNSHVEASSLSAADGLVSSGDFSNAFVADGWPTGARDADLYFSFTVSAVDAPLVIDRIDLSAYNNFEGSGAFELRSSTSGFDTVIASGTLGVIYGAGEPFMLAINDLLVTDEAEIRIYFFNSSGTTSPQQRGLRGTGFGGLGLVVHGTVRQPAPSN